ncbi:MAG: hypothetical protein JWN70_2554 [Planctomycetaceae bacterium]|nr:hypothetical protein [Planctomycetaceae bacterium]
MTIQNAGFSAPLPRMQWLLELLHKKEVIGVHLSTGHPVQLWDAGGVVIVEMRALSVNDTVEMVHSITPDRSRKELMRDGRTCFEYELAEDLWIDVSISGVLGDFVITARDGSGVEL